MLGVGVGCLEFGFWVLGFGVWDLGSGVWGWRLGVWSLGVGGWGWGLVVWRLGCTVREEPFSCVKLTACPNAFVTPEPTNTCEGGRLGFGVRSLGFVRLCVCGFVGCGVWGVRCGVWGVGCGVWGSGCGVLGVGCRVWKLVSERLCDPGKTVDGENGSNFHRKQIANHGVGTHLNVSGREGGKVLDSDRDQRPANHQTCGVGIEV